MLDELLGNQARMVTCAARDNGHALHQVQFLGGHVQLVNAQMAAHHTTRQRVADNARLLVDFLQHEIGIAAFFSGINIPVNMSHGRLNLVAVCIVICDIHRRELGKLAVFQNNDVTRCLQQGNHIACHIRAGCAASYHQRTVLARNHNNAGLGRARYRQTIRAIDAFRCSANSCKKIAVIRAFHQVSHYFGIGCAGKVVSFAFQFFAQLSKVFYDAVMHYRNGAVARYLGMRVCLARLAVRCPTCMTNAACARQANAFHRLLKRRNLSFATHHMQPVGLHNGHAGGVVSTILQLFQALDQEGSRSLRSRITHNSAHRQPLAFA